MGGVGAWRSQDQGRGQGGGGGRSSEEEGQEGVRSVLAVDKHCVNGEFLAETPTSLLSQFGNCKFRKIVFWSVCVGSAETERVVTTRIPLEFVKYMSTVILGTLHTKIVFTV